MDSRAIYDQLCNLMQELARLLENPSVNVPSIRKLVEFELERLNDLQMYLEEGEVYRDEDGHKMMIARISIEFGLSDASSIEHLMNGLTDELRILNLRFQPPLLRIARFIAIALHQLGLKLSREYPNKKLKVATGGSTSRGSISQGPKPDSVGGSSAPASSQVTETQGSPQLDDIVANAIDTATSKNPRGFLLYQVIDLLRQTAPNINLEDEDVTKLIIKKCNEAKLSRDKKLAQGDRDESSSKRG